MYKIKKMKELSGNKRKLLAIYIIWVFINSVTLAMSNWNTYQFWPFSDGRTLLECYDISEFIFYAIGPLVIFYAYLIFTKKDCFKSSGRKTAG